MISQVNMEAKPVYNVEQGSLKPVTHVIFDMDGLLLATEELYTEAANIVAKKFCKAGGQPKVVTWELKVSQMGLQKKELSEIMVRELELTCSPDQYIEETYKLHQELFPKVGNQKDSDLTDSIYLQYPGGCHSRCGEAAKAFKGQRCSNRSCYK